MTKPEYTDLRGKWEHSFRYGLVVRIPGSHPGGPGSIPGNGNFLVVEIFSILEQNVAESLLAR